MTAENSANWKSNLRLVSRFLQWNSSKNVDLISFSPQNTRKQKVKGFLDETSKSSDVGVNDENRSKNRSESVIPYDRNRVILTPNGNKLVILLIFMQISIRTHMLMFFSYAGPQQSSYINATFIEGYDNSESFIITQDPLEETIGDFWRMVSEQSIHTIVMISEVKSSIFHCSRPIY